MKQLPTARQIKKCKQTNEWTLSNDILYKMCRDNFKHDEVGEILAKVIIIGRTYAAAIERRKNKNETKGSGDDFYIKTVAPTFKKSNLDKRLLKLKTIKQLTADNIQQILEVHHYLTTKLFAITKLNKRSFCSKYLHFHLPDLFFIYDSRVVTALRNYSSKVPDQFQTLTKQKNVDEEYAKFFCKCFEMKNTIEMQNNITLTNRQLDNLLIAVSNNK